MNIPAFSLTEQFEEIGPEIMAAVEKVLRSGHYILGPEVEAFEHEMAEYIGVKHAIGVANGSDALNISIMALGIGPGDEVLVPAFTFFATAGAVARTGATPVFCDIDLDTFNIDVEDARKRVTERTKAIIPVHLYGCPADMDGVMGLAKDFGLRVIEDAAQAIGAQYKGKRVGTFGDFSCLSFYPTKNLGACGDAGMVLTNNDELAERLRMLRVHGSKKKYHHEILGYNTRLDEVQAAILRVKLKRLDYWIERRIRVAQLYDSRLAEGIRIKTPKSGPWRHVFHQYTIRCDGRDEVLRGLAQNGVGCTIYYPEPLHRQKAFSGCGEGISLTNAEISSKQVLSLPMYPELQPDVVEFVSSQVLKAVEGV